MATPQSITIDGNDLYIADTAGDEVFVIPADTADGATAVASRRFDLPTGLTNPRGMVIDGNDLYIANDVGDEIFVVPADTANGATATITRRFDLPSASTYPNGMTIDGNDLYIADNSADEIFVIPADTADGATATITRRFDLPTGLTNPSGLAIAPTPLNPINYQNHLNTAFTLTTGNVIYFVYVTGNTDTSELIIRRRTSGGTVSTIFTDRKVLSALTDLDDGGGAYLGCYEAVFLNDLLYMLCPIQRVDEDSGDYTRSQTKAAGAVLFSCDVTAATPTLTVIEKWDFATHSACNLIVHDNAVHYVERPAAAERFKPINSDL